ncbi:MAG: iron-containing alcohol dehydrogenase [Tissierellales bacterium]|nr:iron-containing alcohol dehydrogenase [Tissierellales bacterium]
MMITPFNFTLPTKIIYGVGMLKVLPEELKKMKAKKIMVVTDSKLVALKLTDKLEEWLEGFDYIIFDEIEQNPKDYNITKAADKAVEFGADTLIAFGGGSPIDAAKVVAILAAQGGTVREYMHKERAIEKAIQLITIPTTAGTGSEVTFSSVITDSKEKFKYTVKSPLIASKVAIIDPMMTLTVPPSITAATGMDALTHAIEGYTALCTEPLAEAMGLWAVKYIAESIEKAVMDGSDIEARDKMMMGSLMAGLSFSHSDVAAVHCMAEALGSLYDAPHGVCNAVLLPYVMEYNVTASEKKYAEIAHYMGLYGPNDLMTASEGIENIKIISRRIGLQGLKSLNIKTEDFEILSEMSEKNGSNFSNPKEINRQDYLKIFKRAYADS